MEFDSSLLEAIWKKVQEMPPKPVPIPFASMPAYHDWQSWTIQDADGDLDQMRIWPYRPTLKEMRERDEEVN